MGTKIAVGGSTKSGRAGGSIYPLRCAFSLFGTLILLSLALTWFLLTMLRAHPEVLMVTRSQCANPVQNWNGKIVGIPVWTNWLEREPPQHSIHFRPANASSVFGSGDGKQLLQTGQNAHLRRRKMTMMMDTGSIQSVVDPKSYRHHVSDGFGGLWTTNLQANEDSESTGEKRSVIIWGTHHRSGTYIAQKLFSTICSHMRWCCLFHPTRSSLSAVHDSLLKERTVHVFGHNQWIWRPQEVLGEHVSYRFVHFYRDPVQKVISGYLFHKDGNEAWTRRQGRFGDICEKASAIMGKGQSTDAGRTKGGGEQRPSLDDVYDYCHAVHLCETCCRKAHEHAQRGQALGQEGSVFRARDQGEYDFICENLGRPAASGSLQDTLAGLPLPRGLLLEAALDYYENQRMVQLLQETQHDPHTLHVDVDDVYFHHEENMRRILAHIDLGLAPENLESLLGALNFYSLRTSWYYTSTMNSVLQTHAYSPSLYASQSNNFSTQNEALRDALLGYPPFVRLYSPLLRAFAEHRASIEGGHVRGTERG